MQLGQLDGIIDGEIYGWAFDSERPDQAINVSVHIDNAHVATALAGYYRPDVAAAFQNSGRHGFFVDLSRLGPSDIEGAIEVRAPNGAALNGAPVHARVPLKNRDHRPTLVFLHMPKTAGTAFRQAMLCNYKQSEVIYLYPTEPGFPVDNIEDVPYDQRSRSRLIAGHNASYGIHERIPNECLYVTLVREPVSRVWSNYTHLQRSTDPRLVRDRVGTLKDLQESNTRVDFDNLMVRYFAGLLAAPPGSINVDAYERARWNLRYAFGYVGHQEHPQRAYEWLQLKLGWAPASVPLMNTTEYPGAACCSSSQEKLIRHFNHWDCRLYSDILAGNE